MESSTSNSDEIGDEMKLHGVGQFVDHEVVSQNKEINLKTAREMLAKAVVVHDLPQSWVEYEGVRNIWKCLNPDFPCFSRKDIVSEINKLYLKEKAKLKQVLANTKNRVCLTLDVLSACPDECYICLAARFVDEDWKLNCKILNFDRVDSPDIERNELAAKTGDFLMEWGIHEKVFSLTLDNKSRNDTVRDVLKKQLLLGNNLLCGGEFFHGYCVADILDLIVQNGLSLCADLLVKVRDSVNYVSGSESRRKRFAECVSQFSDIDSNVDLRVDICTSWNLTYLMLDSAIKYRKAFASFRLLEQDYIQFCPTDEEWDRGEKICKFLEPYYDIYNSVCDSSSTSHLYFAQVWIIVKLLKENLSNEDATISGLCGSMIEKLDKYWHENSMMLSFGAILDPRLKLQALERLYSAVESDSNKCQERISLVKSMLYKLFEDYRDASKSSSSQSQSSSPKRRKSFYDDFLEFQRRKNAGKSQLDLYLEEPELWFEDFKDFDILEYWKSRRYQYPDLAVMACDVLAFPITTIASESGFSMGAHLLTKYKSSVVPKNIQHLICTRSWLHGLVVSNDDDDCLRTKTTLSDEGSNDGLDGPDDCESFDDGCSRSKASLSDEGSDGWESVDEDA